MRPPPPLICPEMDHLPIGVSRLARRGSCVVRLPATAAIDRALAAGAQQVQAVKQPGWEGGQSFLRHKTRPGTPIRTPTTISAS
ncbi:hypothetical protein CMUS01_07083 [Colletotrichum musicola]|uniref:Uncharacterized protein n=1 Tax=Colletotrichum musicola TaxID=2175873 RepID=A0A8H6NFV7_9PEZI|nr:hypothetical protein CMUS01_07083 [Colletotrichum musicola]